MGKKAETVGLKRPTQRRERIVDIRSTALGVAIHVGEQRKLGRRIGRCRSHARRRGEQGLLACRLDAFAGRGVQAGQRRAGRQRNCGQFLSAQHESLAGGVTVVLDRVIANDPGDRCRKDGAQRDQTKARHEPESSFLPLRQYQQARDQKESRRPNCKQQAQRRRFEFQINTHYRPIPATDNRPFSAQKYGAAMPEKPALGWRAIDRSKAIAGKRQRRSRIPRRAQRSSSSWLSFATRSNASPGFLSGIDNPRRRTATA